MLIMVFECQTSTLWAVLWLALLISAGLVLNVTISMDTEPAELIHRTWTYLYMIILLTVSILAMLLMLLSGKSVSVGF